MKELFLLYVLTDINNEVGTLAGVFVEYDNAVRCRNYLLTRKSDLNCWIVRCKPDRLIEPYRILDAIS